MEYRRLGKAGVQVSALSLGSWVTFGQQISDDVAAELMTTAYENGVNFFDNAEAYASGKSEQVMGNILRKKGWAHDTFLVSSKVFWGGALPNQTGLSRKHVLEACHAALRRLQVEYLDLYFCHRPDPNTPIEETVRAMSDLVTQGKVLYWGTSEWSAQEITQAHGIARELGLVPPTMEQPMYHLLGRHRLETEYARLYTEYGMGTTTWSPLASGLLTGKHKGGPAEGTRASLKDYGWLKERIANDGKTNAEKIEKLGKIAQDLGLSLAVFAIAWCLKNPHVSTVILGASKVAQLTENLQAIEAQAKLTPEVMKTVDELVGV
ncbi:MAG TPA: aldo/keto reductase [Candidatus Methylacidiphilales bacterium]|jgi:voltage-dependent potassium channel beta subunit|nr:aldo/keto reductase [Candidatus Methylacidiphilales bacterium]